MTGPLRARFRRFVAWSGKERFLVGASVLRVIAGATILYQYVITYRQRHFIYGPDGVVPHELSQRLLHETGSVSLYALSRSPAWFELLYHLGMAAALAWACGYRTRLTSPLNLALWWSLHQRFPGLGDGGDNAMQIALIYALFADPGAHFTVGRPAPRPRSTWARKVRAMFHNAAMLAIAVQVAILYAVAGLSKIPGETWRNGTALYYPLRAGQFAWFGEVEAIYQNATLLTILAYATVGFQLAFPLLVCLNRRTRVMAVIIAVAFHIGIAIFLGLGTFAAFMIALDLSLVSDAEYAVLGRAFQEARGRGEEILGKLRARSRAIIARPGGSDPPGG